MSHSQRLEFVTRHFRDLQTIRFAPLPLAMILLSVAAPQSPHLSRAAAWTILLTFLTTVFGFYFWSNAALRRRYGSVRTSREEQMRMWFHPVIFLISIALVIALTWVFFTHRQFFWEIYVAYSVITFMLMKALDSTNLPIRRLVWGLGLAILLAGVPLIGDSPALGALGGGVWLAVSIFDFLLLRRIFDQNYPAVPDPGAVMRHG